MSVPRNKYMATWLLQKLWGVTKVGEISRYASVYRARCPHHLADGQGLTIVDNARGHIAKYFTSCPCSLDEIAAAVKLEPLVITPSKRRGA